VPRAGRVPESGPGKEPLTSQDDRPARDRIGDWAYARTRDAILDGELEPGSRLSVPDLARRLGISRSPARESILRLLSEGLAEEIPHRGAFVSDITVDDLVDLYAVRAALEGLAARLAAGNIDPENRRALEKSLEVHRSAIDDGDRHEITEADMAFHHLLYRISDNPWLLDTLLRLQSLVRLGMRTTMTVPGSPGHALREHEGILAALIDQNPTEAERKARGHVERLRSTLRTRRI